MIIITNIIECELSCKNTSQNKPSSLNCLNQQQKGEESRMISITKSFDCIASEIKFYVNQFLQKKYENKGLKMCETLRNLQIKKITGSN